MEKDTIPSQNTSEHPRIAISIFFFISGFGYSTWASRIPSIQQQLNLNEAELGAVLFALPIGLMCTMPLTSFLLRRFSSNRIMLYGCLLFNLILCLPGLTSSILQLALVLLCFGSARNLLNISMNAQAVAVQSFYKKSIITTFHAIWSVAGFAGAGLGYFMVKYDVAPIYHLPIVGILLCLISLLAYPNTLTQPTIKEEKKPFFSLPDKYILKYALICFACMACENTMYDWGIIYFEKTIVNSASVSTIAFVVYMITMTISRFLGDKIVNSFGVVNILKYSGWLIFIGLMMSVLFPYSYILLIGFGMVGIGVSCIVPLIFSLVGKSTKTNTGTAIAAVSTIGYLGFLIVPPLVGFVAHLTNLRWAFGIISLLGLLIIFMTNKIEKSDN
jgi:MFS family permease